MIEMPRCETCRFWNDIWREPATPAPLFDEQGKEVFDENYRRVSAPGRWGNCTKVGEFVTRLPSGST